MRKHDTSHRPIAAGRIFELRTPSPFDQGEQSLPITADVCTTLLISVLADIIVATCTTIGPVASQQIRHSDDGQSLEH
jgi:hypothetical protein